MCPIFLGSNEVSALKKGADNISSIYIGNIEVSLNSLLPWQSTSTIAWATDSIGNGQSTETTYRDLADAEYNYATSLNDGTNGRSWNNDTGSSDPFRGNEGDVTGANKQDVLVLQMGTNDVFDDPANVTAADHKKDWRETMVLLLDAGYTAANMHIMAPGYRTDASLDANITALPGNGSPTTADRRTYYLEYKTEMLDLATEFGTYWTDIYASIEENFSPATNGLLDQVHPNNSGHLQIYADMKDPAKTFIPAGTTVPGLVVTSPADNQIQITWTGGGEIEYYYLTDGGYGYVADGTSSTSPVLLTGVTAGNYRVVARPTGGRSTVSAALIVTQSAVADTFTAADNTELSAYTGESGYSYVATGGAGGTARIEANRVRGDAFTCYNRIDIGAVGDQQVTCDMVVGTGAANKMGPAVRMAADGTRTWYYCWLDTNNTTLRLTRIIATVATNLASYNFASAQTSSTFSVRIKAVGTTISVEVDEGSGFVEQMSVTDVMIATGCPGIHAQANVASGVGVEVDNLLYEPL